MTPRRERTPGVGTPGVRQEATALAVQYTSTPTSTRAYGTVVGESDHRSARRLS